MIKINNVVDRTVEVYYNEQHIGTINTQYQLNDIRLQVKKQKLSGVYFHFLRPDGVVERIDCNSSGNLCRWPKGFFDVIEKQLWNLLDKNME